MTKDIVIYQILAKLSYSNLLEEIVKFWSARFLQAINRIRLMIINLIWPGAKCGHFIYDKWVRFDMILWSL